jgi:ATP-dependent Lhr-like helicase
MLATTRTVIVDEIHALAPNKRGSHLALSLERLARLCGDRLQRVGLSATQKPIEEVARFLVGTAGVGANTPVIMDSGHRRARDLALEVPESPLEAVMSAEVWDSSIIGWPIWSENTERPSFSSTRAGWPCHRLPRTRH